MNLMILHFELISVHTHKYMQRGCVVYTDFAALQRILHCKNCVKCERKMYLHVKTHEIGGIFAPTPNAEHFY